jgi:hypothetical protein
MGIKKRVASWYMNTILAIKTGWVVLTPGARIEVQQPATLPRSRAMPVPLILILRKSVREFDFVVRMMPRLDF